MISTASIPRPQAAWLALERACVDAHASPALSLHGAEVCARWLRFYALSYQAAVSAERRRS